MPTRRTPLHRPRHAAAGMSVEALHRLLRLSAAYQRDPDAFRDSDQHAEWAALERLGRKAYGVPPWNPGWWNPSVRDADLGPPPQSAFLWDQARPEAARVRREMLERLGLTEEDLQTPE